MLSYQKVGGIHFIRLGRVNISWSVSRRRRVGKVARVMKVATYDYEFDEHVYEFVGVNSW